MRTFIALCQQLGRHPSVHDSNWRDLLLTVDVPFDAAEMQMATHTFDALGSIGPAVSSESELTLMDKAPRPRQAWRISLRI